MDHGAENKYETGIPCEVQEHTDRDWKLDVRDKRVKLKQDAYDTAEDVTSVWVLVSQSEVDENSRFVLLNCIADADKL